MSYIDAIHDIKNDRIHVVERSPKGERVYKEYPTNYVFYYPDPKGKYRSIFGDPLSRFSTRKRNEFEKEKRIHNNKKLFESDVNPVFRCLADNYLGVEPPKLHTCFFDIEVDFDPERGFSPTDDPFNPVTSISCYLDWLDQLITLAIPPKHMTDETAAELVKDFPNTFLFRSEIEMFETFFQLIEDADIVTGWNSEGYDIPYCVNRVTRIMSKDDTRKFCLLGQLPKVRTYERFGKEETTYDLVGRVHMDYLQLYKKYNYESRHSYSLDAIGEMEVGERKTQYEGSLDQLYNQDFKTFIEYNRQDTMLMVKIHRKTKFLELANALAHENTVLLPTAMGSVAMIEMAVINEAHDRGLIVPDKNRSQISDEQQAAGAYVAPPQSGMHQWVGAVDINSLYPSDIRALNMSPETIVAQVRQTLTNHYMAEKSLRLAKQKKKRKKNIDEGVTGAILWEGLFGSLEYNAIMNQERGTILTVDYENGRSVEMSAAEIWDMIFNSNNPYILSANGTIFTYEKEGVIPGLLTRWYSERKSIQKQAKESKNLGDMTMFEYYDKRQLVRKILLNSAYGALLNEHCRFYDKRIGQSVTLSGRQIVKHMMSKINEIIEGTYSHEGPAIVYGDTDSCYFSAYPLLKNQIDSGDVIWDKDTCIALYDNIAEQTNESFPAFMEKAFHCPRKNGSVIKAGRELIGDRAIFITKKIYAINIFDLEGDRLDLITDPIEAKKKNVNIGYGKVKAMGVALKRSDTPKYIQEFLMSVLCMVIQQGKDRDNVIEKIKDFKKQLANQESWTKGNPKSVNKLTHHTAKFEKTGECGVGHARAAINYNYLRRMNNDQYSQKIVDGMKVIVCSLKNNPLGFTSIAYPTDELRLPEWFKSLPFDDKDMERKLVDEKIENLLGVLNWDLRTDTDTNSTFSDLFSFD
jgi:DNA polymerase elongation subunit (family B)